MSRTPDPAPGLVRHGALTRWFWPRWFAHDGVHPNPAHLRTLRRLLPDHRLTEHRAPVPYLPGLRVPYYVFVGSKTVATAFRPGVAGNVRSSRGHDAAIPQC